jgi:hypothetical protein
MVRHPDLSLISGLHYFSQSKENLASELTDGWKNGWMDEVLLFYTGKNL